MSRLQLRQGAAEVDGRLHRPAARHSREEARPFATTAPSAPPGTNIAASDPTDPGRLIRSTDTTMTPRKPPSSAHEPSKGDTEYRLVCPRNDHEEGPASSRSITKPEMPAAKNDRTGGQREPSSADGDDGSYEVWRLEQQGRTHLGTFLYLSQALDAVHARSEGRYDIRLPNGKWFSEIQTVRTRRSER